jgi:hypothetical protein
MHRLLDAKNGPGEVGNQRLKVANGSIGKNIALIPGQPCLHNCWVERLGPDGIPVYHQIQNSRRMRPSHFEP